MKGKRRVNIKLTNTRRSGFNGTWQSNSSGFEFEEKLEENSTRGQCRDGNEAMNRKRTFDNKHKHSNGIAVARPNDYLEEQPHDNDQSNDRDRPCDNDDLNEDKCHLFNESDNSSPLNFPDYDDKRDEIQKNGLENLSSNLTSSLNHVSNKSFSLDVDLADHLRGHAEVQLEITNELHGLDMLGAQDTYTSSRSDSATNGFRCKFCPNGFAKNYYLTKHVLRKHPEAVESGSYECNLCDRSFRRQFQLMRHYKTHSRDDEPKKNVERYKCDVCQRAFTKNYYLVKHMRRKHSDAAESSVYVCDACGRTFGEHYALQRHRRTHDGDSSCHYECFVCRKSFRSSLTLRRHMMTHNDEEKITGDDYDKEMGREVCCL